jgi:hypothetical protein
MVRSSQIINQRGSDAENILQSTGQILIVQMLLHATQCSHLPTPMRQALMLELLEFKDVHHRVHLFKGKTLIA